MHFPSLSRGCEIAQFYAPQTKILEGGTKDEMRLFEALFKDVSTRFGLRTIESPFENPELIFCSFFQNLRLGSINFLFAIPAMIRIVSLAHRATSNDLNTKHPSHHHSRCRSSAFSHTPTTTSPLRTKRPSPPRAFGADLDAFGTRATSSS
jgi:hypothetical protein